VHRRAIAAALALVVATACTSTSTDRGAPEEPEPSEVTEPSGQVTFGVLGEPATLDPYSPRASDLTFALTEPLYPSFFELLPDGSVQPQLATEVRSTPSGVVVELGDMSWSDGTPVTPGDVVATWRRATLPSGLALARSARVRGGAVVFEGDVDEWERALAIRSPILPGGRAGRIFGGPFVQAARTPGLEIVYEPNPEWSGPGPMLRRLTVQHIDSTDTMLALLEDGRLDAAAVPASVNLAERLEILGLEHDAALGWESIRVAIGREASRDEGAGVVAAIGAGDLDAGLLRGDGDVTETLWPNVPDAPAARRGGGSLPGEAALAVPEGDELMFLLQRAMQISLAEHGSTMDLYELPVRRLYSRLPAEVDLALMRVAGDPLGPLLDPRPRALPLFHVRTYIAYRDGVEGVVANPSVEGPLWNAETWRVSTSK
jgi:hypothetical protein